MASTYYQQQQRERASRSSSRWVSPQRTVVWTERNNKAKEKKKKVPVVYYLCREDGQLEHPHFMEVSLSLISSSSEDKNTTPVMCLRDFTERLDMLRGKGMASLYSWSCKRSYRNGFVWHDLTEDDIVHPAAAHPNSEYVLKGSHRLALSSTSSHGRCRRNWSKSLDLAEYNRQVVSTEEEELGIDEISPPPSAAGSPDDTLVDKDQEKVGVIARGRMRASSVLMQLISCGSLKSHHSSHNNKIIISHENHNKIASSSTSHTVVDYFSGSLVETTTAGSKKKKTALTLKRSSSYNAATDRRRLELEESNKEEEETTIRSGACA